MKRLLVAVAVMAAFSFTSACFAQTYTPATPAEVAAYSLGGSGLPVEAMVIYTADTDPNHLLGRPGQYTGKVSWHDIRAGDLVDGITPESTIETFDSLTDLQRRATYMNAIINASPLFGQYMFEDDAHLALLRVPFALTADQAADYQAWLAAL